MSETDTDLAWEEWGKRDPYYGVITNPKFRREGLTEEAKREFFESGRLHADYVLHMIAQYIDPTFRPRNALDFGCGVGRLLVPLASRIPEVVGLDVSPSMLQEAQRNCEAHGISNVRLLASDDFISSLSQRFDLIHSYIVFQHIPADRGRLIFRKLVAHLSPGGVGAVHFVYSKAQYSSTNGVAPRTIPAAPASVLENSRAKPLPASLPPGADPEMQMNPYHPTELLFILQSAGVLRFHTEFTDHGGELGLFIFFQKPH